MPMPGAPPPPAIPTFHRPRSTSPPRPHRGRAAPVAPAPRPLREAPRARRRPRPAPRRLHRAGRAPRARGEPPLPRPPRRGGSDRLPPRHARGAPRHGPLRARAPDRQLLLVHRLALPDRRGGGLAPCRLHRSPPPLRRLEPGELRRQRAAAGEPRVPDRGPRRSPRPALLRHAPLPPRHGRLPPLRGPGPRAPGAGQGQGEGREEAPRQAREAREEVLREARQEAPHGAPRGERRRRPRRALPPRLRQPRPRRRRRPPGQRPPRLHPPGEEPPVPRVPRRPPRGRRGLRRRPPGPRDPRPPRRLPREPRLPRRPGLQVHRLRDTTVSARRRRRWGAIPSVSSRVRSAASGTKHEVTMAPGATPPEVLLPSRKRARRGRTERAGPPATDQGRARERSHSRPGSVSAERRTPTMVPDSPPAASTTTARPSGRAPSGMRRTESRGPEESTRPEGGRR